MTAASRGRPASLASTACPGRRACRVHLDWLVSTVATERMAGLASLALWVRPDHPVFPAEWAKKVTRASRQLDDRAIGEKRATPDKPAYPVNLATKDRRDRRA